ncbi:MAG: helix-turn-helix domain-containing protein [Megasphaera cerevisiae]|jgi:transcriptional regulator with XRE-family HTH domain|nr:helix-turn-helix domain-containing protein [Megasphaera cerevisiae]
MSFGAYFRKLRISKHVTQKQVAEKVGKTTMLVSGVETNKNKPFLDCDLEKISTLLELSTEEHKDLLKKAARARGTLPTYLLEYVNGHNEIYELLEVFVDEHMKSDSLKKIVKYAKELKNV